MVEKRLNSSLICVQRSDPQQCVTVILDCKISLAQVVLKRERDG